MTDGVPIPDLHCPTCGLRFKLPLEVHQNDEPDPWTLGTPTFIVRRESPYIICPAGHKWTIQFVQRAVNDPEQPDRVLLDQYIGGGA